MYSLETKGTVFLGQNVCGWIYWQLYATPWLVMSGTQPVFQAPLSSLFPTVPLGAPATTSHRTNVCACHKACTQCTFRVWLTQTQHYMFVCCYWSLLYSAIHCSRADSLCLHVIWSRWVTCFFWHVFLISTEVVYLQRWHGWCHMKLQPSRRKFCVHHAAMHHVTSCKATYVRCCLLYTSDAADER